MTYRAVTVCLALALMVPALCAAETFVGGTITTATWTAANSPYRVVDTLVVPAGEVLTIEPGVDLVFDTDMAAQCAPFLLVEGN